MLERKWNIKRSAHKYMTVEIDRLPNELQVLVPYMDFFCVENQSYREEFLKSLPQICFEELYSILSSIRQHFLRDWLAEDVNYESNNKNWNALAVLNEIPGEYI